VLHRAAVAIIMFYEFSPCKIFLFVWNLWIRSTNSKFVVFSPNVSLLGVESRTTSETKVPKKKQIYLVYLFLVPNIHVLCDQ
jgi:hypothetical protein